MDQIEKEIQLKRKEMGREKGDEIAEEKRNFLEADVDKDMVILMMFLAVAYFVLITFTFGIGNKVLFSLLILGEIFHVTQVLLYMWTIMDLNYEAPKDTDYREPVDVFITVAGEPVEIVEETVRAAKVMDYPSFKVHVLNDGFVAKKDNWKEIEEMSKRLGVNCITRKVPGGAKAGNINNGVSLTEAPLFVVFDADHVPHADFLSKTVPYFFDQKVGFVQTPQFYKNHNVNYITKSAWEQQQLFFGPICRGKNRHNAVSMCGTNMVLRRKALEEVGGVSHSIAEDFLTGLRMHQRGWKSVYVPEVLAEGMAPEDFLSYHKQQFRWARGALDVIFPRNFLLDKGLTIKQKLQYFSSISFFFSGLIVLMNAMIPIIYLFTGIVPIITSTMLLASIFLPYLFLTLYLLQKSSNFNFTFRALTFSMGAFNIHIMAFWSALTRQKVSFSITSKKQLQGNFINLVIPHISYIALTICGLIFALYREGLSASYIANMAWALLNVSIFIPSIYAALPHKKSSVVAHRHSLKNILPNLRPKGGEDRLMQKLPVKSI